MTGFLLRRSAAALLFPLAATGAVYGFTAANTVPDSFAGDGSKAISGYAVSAITYTVGGLAEDEVTAVAFTLGSASAATYVPPKIVEVKLTTAGAWYACVVGTPNTSITCNTSAGAQKVADVANLRVLATQ